MLAIYKSWNHCVKSVRIWNYSSPHFPTFGLNTERYFVSLLILRMWENTDQNNSEYGHFLRSELISNAQNFTVFILLKIGYKNIKRTTALSSLHR